jgi:hypothetical protein
VGLASPVPVAGLFATALRHTRTQPGADVVLLAGGAVLAIEDHEPKAAKELLCASGGGGLAPLGPSSVAELRALLCGTLVDKWLLLFLAAVARGAKTIHDGSAAAAGVRAAAGHVAVMVSSRAAVGDSACTRLLCTIALGCCAGKATATSQGGGGGGGHERGDDGSGGAGRWSENVAAATVDLAVLVGPDAQRLERTSAAWLQRSLGKLSPTLRRLRGTSRCWPSACWSATGLSGTLGHRRERGSWRPPPVVAAVAASRLPAGVAGASPAPQPRH